MRLHISHKQFSVAAIIVMVVFACATDELSNPLDDELKQLISAVSPTGDPGFYILPSQKDYANIPQEPKNPLSEVKVELGKMLFNETGFALSPKYPMGKGTYSCASCHIPEAGFMPGREQGIADGGIGFGKKGEARIKAALYENHEPDIQGARALSIVNVAFVPNTTWSGQFGSSDNNIGTESVWAEKGLTINKLGYKGLESQIIEVIVTHRMVFNAKTVDTLGYKFYFDSAFPEFPNHERYANTTAAFALAAYLRTVISNEAPFQSWLKGNTYAMPDAEKRGALLFFGKAGCYKCHNDKPLNNPTKFYAVGVKDLYETGRALNTDINDNRNLGRGGFTKKAEDMYKFKVPQLYNLHGGSHFFHGSSMQSLREVVEYFNKGKSENLNVPASQIAPQFRPLNLSSQEIDDLVLFLEQSLYDQKMQRYVPTKVLSGSCFPNNDPQSRSDMGCK